ncbi:threonine/serine exporter family protein [Microbacterium testaceum]|uniref:threonine/serine exporter family protein n=1 Tax=Microbacterium testaceum TaxID=2033 RepID=UPI000A792A3D|nr:threonine/serine exporter family protein [Microbacterium testaceum]
MSPTPRRLLSSLRRLVHTEDSGSPDTHLLPVIDEAFSARILDLAIRIGETMLVVGAPASEVTLTIVRVCGAYGLDPVHVDVTYNSITIAHSRPGASHPTTLLRVVRGSVPDHAKLQRLQALVAEIAGGLALDDAHPRSRAIRRLPFRHPPALVIAAQAGLAVGGAILFDATWPATAL